MREQKGTPLSRPDVMDIVVNYESSRGEYMRDCVPCLTVARCKTGSAHWLLGHNRRLTLTELCRLQGVDPALTASTAVNFRKLGGMLGNAFTVPVVARVLRSLLLRGGLVRLPDTEPRPRQPSASLGGEVVG